MDVLSVDQLNQGRIRALDNARSLVDEAKLLHDNQRWARVVFLAQIAGEELGKYLMLASALIDVIADADRFDWRAFWRRFTSHREKLKMVTYFEDLALTEPKPPTEYFADLNTTVNELETGKQKSLYADITEGSFYSPLELYNESIASNALKWAQGRVGLVGGFEDTVKHAADSITPEAISEFRTRFGLTELANSQKKNEG